MKKPYHIVNREEKTAAAAIEEFAKANGQLLLPLVELITEARIAVDEIIGVVGRKTRHCRRNSVILRSLMLEVYTRMYTLAIS